MADQIDLFSVEPVEVVVAESVSWRFGRRRVPEWACLRALSVLQDYNNQTGQKLGAFRFNGDPSEALKRITGAVLDHPEVAEARWSEVVACALRDPWWRGPASPGVVFGPGVVDRNLAADTASVGVGVRLTTNGQLLRALGA